jgi:glycosyltransferase involved in cell wall biosynthesis
VRHGANWPHKLCKGPCIHEQVPLTILSVAFSLAVVGPDSVGGAEQILLQIDGGLVNRGHRSLVVARPESQVAGTLIPTKSVAIPISDTTWRSAHNAVRRAIAFALERYPVDLIHMHDVHFANYLPEQDIPVVVTLHLPLHCYKKEALKIQRSHTFFQCVSTSQRRLLAGKFPLVAEIENSVPPNLFRERVDIRKAEFAAAMGRIAPEKGFHLALRACREANTSMLLAGQVFPFDDHQRYFQEEIVPELDGKRRYVGPVGMRSKQRLLTSAYCLIVPSLVPETSSLVAREALACGTPVVAFANGALPDVVRHGKTGFLVERAGDLPDAIRACRLLDGADCRRDALERFSPEIMIDRYIEMYQGILRNSCRLSEAS